MRKDLTRDLRENMMALVEKKRKKKRFCDSSWDALGIKGIWASMYLSAL